MIMESAILFICVLENENGFFICISCSHLETFLYAQARNAFEKAVLYLHILTGRFILVLEHTYFIF